jgi:hypothetical protein
VGKALTGQGTAGKGHLRAASNGAEGGFTKLTAGVKYKWFAHKEKTSFHKGGAATGGVLLSMTQKRLIKTSSNWQRFPELHDNTLFAPCIVFCHIFP